MKVQVTVVKLNDFLISKKIKYLMNITETNIIMVICSCMIAEDYMIYQTRIYPKIFLISLGRLSNYQDKQNWEHKHIRNKLGFIWTADCIGNSATLVCARIILRNIIVFLCEHGDQCWSYLKNDFVVFCLLSRLIILFIYLFILK